MKYVIPVLESLEKALVGSELKKSPALEKFVDKYIHASGRAKDIPSTRSKLLSLAFGNEHALNVSKSRYLSGGLLGPGGLLLGELAPSQEYLDLIKRTAQSGSKDIVDPATGRLISKNRALLKIIGKTPLESINPVFTLGLPLMDVKSALDAKPGDENYGARGVGSAIGSGLGFALTAPFGIAGSLAGGHLGSAIGEGIGGLFSSVDKDYGKQKPMRINYKPAIAPLVGAAADLMFDQRRSADYT